VPPDALTLRITEGDLFGRHSGDLTSASESKGQLHILEPPGFNKAERPVNHPEVARLGGIAGPLVGALKEEPRRRISQKRSHTRSGLLIIYASSLSREAVAQHATYFI
jgi:hypothetical protein